MNLKIFFGFFGFLYFLKILRGFILYCYNLCFGKKRDLTKIYGKNSYAVVTGGSEGIGLGIAKQLAEKGFNLFLVARNQSRLEDAKAKIELQYPACKVITRTFDFTKMHEPENHDVSVAFNFDFSTIDVSILVNNVGIGLPTSFYNCTEEEILNLIKVNCLTQILLTRYFAGLFKKRPGKSAVLNLSSLAGLSEIPNFTLYGASKAFNLYFNESRGNFDEKIDYYCLLPGQVSTNLTKYIKGFSSITPDTCADYAMRNFGSYRYVFSGHIIHEIIGVILSIVPGWMMPKGIKNSTSRTAK